MGRVILVLQDNHQVLPTGAFQAANMEVGQLLEPPMEAQHPVVHMGHHLVEDHMATHPLPPQGICMEEAQHQEGLMGNHLLIHMALLSPDPMGQEVLAVVSPLVWTQKPSPGSRAWTVTTAATSLLKSSGRLSSTPTGLPSTMKLV